MAAVWRDLTTTRESSCWHSPLRSARLTALHATCHLSIFVVPRSHAALPLKPDLTRIARASRHATPETAGVALHLRFCWRRSTLSPPKADASSVVNGTRLDETQHQGDRHGQQPLSVACLEIASSYAVPNQLALCSLRSQAIHSEVFRLHRHLAPVWPRRPLSIICVLLPSRLHIARVSTRPPRSRGQQ